MIIPATKSYSFVSVSLSTVNLKKEAWSVYMKFECEIRLWTGQVQPVVPPTFLLSIIIRKHNKLSTIINVVIIIAYPGCKLTAPFYRYQRTLLSLHSHEPRCMALQMPIQYESWSVATHRMILMLLLYMLCLQYLLTPKSSASCVVLLSSPSVSSWEIFPISSSASSWERPTLMHASWKLSLVVISSSWWEGKK